MSIKKIRKHNERVDKTTETHKEFHDKFTGGLVVSDKEVMLPPVAKQFIMGLVYDFITHMPSINLDIARMMDKKDRKLLAEGLTNLSGLMDIAETVLASLSEGTSSGLEQFSTEQWRDAVRGYTLGMTTVVAAQEGGDIAKALSQVHRTFQDKDDAQEMTSDTSFYVSNTSDTGRAN